MAFAKKLMSERGADMFTVTKMDKGADVVIESIYRYFSDSSALIRTLLVERNNEVSDALTEKFAPVKRCRNLWRRLKSWLIFHSSRLDQNSAV